MHKKNYLQELLEILQTFLIPTYFLEIWWNLWNVNLYICHTFTSFKVQSLLHVFLHNAKLILHNTSHIIHQYSK